jgi:hypothetical protein
MRLADRQLTLGVANVVPVEQGIKRMPWLFGVALKYVVRTTECVELLILEEHRVRGTFPA